MVCLFLIGQHQRTQWASFFHSEIILEEKNSALVAYLCGTTHVSFPTHDTHERMLLRNAKHINDKV